MIVLPSATVSIIIAILTLFSHHVDYFVSYTTLSLSLSLSLSHSPFQYLQKSIVSHWYHIDRLGEGLTNLD